MQYQSFSCDASFTHCWCNWQFNLGVFNHVRPRALSHSATHNHNLTIFTDGNLSALANDLSARSFFWCARWDDVRWESDAVTKNVSARHLCRLLLYMVHSRTVLCFYINSKTLSALFCGAGWGLAAAPPPALFLSLYNMHACVVERVRRAVPGYRKHKRCLKCHMRGTNNVRPFINREKPTSWALWGPRHFVRSLHQARHQMVLARQNSLKFWIWARPWSTMHLALRHSAF